MADEGFKRKLTAILSADVKGYSRLMGEDDQAIKSFFNKGLVKFLEKHQIHHLESNGEALIIFRYLHIAPADEVQNLLEFSYDLLDHMNLN